MADTRNDIEYIDRFFRSELSAKEEENYTKRLQQDPAFRKLHEEQKMVAEGIAYASRQEIKHRLNAIEQELQDTDAPATTPQPLKYYRSMAAGLILLIAGISFYYIYASYSNSSRLYDTYFNPPASIEVPRTRGTNVAARAADSYNNNDFNAAEKQFNHAIKEHAAYNLLYYQALTEMQLQKFDEAENLFKHILAEPNGYHSGAHWYLALIYIKKKQPDEAKPHLQELASSNNDFSIPATNLLAEL